VPGLRAAALGSPRRETQRYLAVTVLPP
jgi:hypothetical protein